MLGFNANLTPRPPTRRYYITRLGIASNIVKRILACATQGAVACMLSHVAWQFAHSIFGQVLLPGIAQLPVQWLASVLPVAAAPYAGTILLASAGGMIVFNFLNALRSNMMTSTYMAPSEEDENLPYTAKAIVLPMTLFALGLKTSFLSFSAAYGVVFCTSAAVGVMRIIVRPTINDLQLWQGQAALFEKNDHDYQQQLLERERGEIVSHTPAPVSTPTPVPTPTFEPPAAEIPFASENVSAPVVHAFNLNNSAQQAQPLLAPEAMNSNQADINQITHPQNRMGN